MMRKLPGQWHLRVDSNTIIIRDGSGRVDRANAALTGTIVLIAVLIVAVMLALPTLGVILNQAREAWEWSIALGFLALGMSLAAFILPWAIRLIIPWQVTITSDVNATWVGGGSMGRLMPRKRYCTISTVVARPAYQRGEWGYWLSIEFRDGRRFMLTPPVLLGASIANAKSRGLRAAAIIAQELAAEHAATDWERHEQLAERRRHNEG